jgi:hypothetical protein
MSKKTAVQDDLAKLKLIISRLDLQAQARIEIIANLLRNMINAREGGHEAELAFALVLAERAVL